MCIFTCTIRNFKYLKNTFDLDMFHHCTFILNYFHFCLQSVLVSQLEEEIKALQDKDKDVCDRTEAITGNESDDQMEEDMEYDELMHGASDDNDSSYMTDRIRRRIIN